MPRHDKDERWTTVGIVLRVRPDLVENLLDRLSLTDGVHVVFSKTSNKRILIKEVPFP